MAKVVKYMDKTDKKKQAWLTKRNITIAIVIVLLLGAITITTTTLLVPARSKETFCTVVSENKSQLMSANTSLKVKLDIYKKLERVAPGDLANDLQRIVNAYQSSIDKPEGSFGAGLGIVGEIDRLNDYIKSNCTE